MKKIILIPTNLDLSKGSEAWNFIKTPEFSNLRNGTTELLTDEQISFLRSKFEKWVALTDEEVVTFCVEEDKPLSIAMMTAASYELMNRMLNK